MPTTVPGQMPPSYMNSAQSNGLPPNAVPPHSPAPHYHHHGQHGTSPHHGQVQAPPGSIPLTPQQQQQWMMAGIRPGSHMHPVPTGMHAQHQAQLQMQRQNRVTTVERPVGIDPLEILEERETRYYFILNVYCGIDL